MSENGDMEEFLWGFQEVKRKVEENDINLVDDMYKTALLVAMPESYRIIVSIVEN